MINSRPAAGQQAFSCSTARNSFIIPESGLVYGHILVTKIGDGYVVLGNPESRKLDTYDFDIKGKKFLRDVFTAMGSLYNGRV